MFAIWMNGKATQIHLGHEMPPYHLESETQCNAVKDNLIEVYEEVSVSNTAVTKVDGTCYRIHEASI